MGQGSLKTVFVFQAADCFSGCLICFGDVVCHFMRFVIKRDFQFAEQAADNGFGYAVFALFVLAQELLLRHF